MISIFISQTWKKFTRSVSFGKEMATSLFLAFIGLMMVGYSLALGFALNAIIVNGLKIENSVAFLNSILLYYFIFEFVMRYFLQNLPALYIQPYLHLPIKKSGIVHYLLTKSSLHVINALPLLLFTPFSFQVIATQSGSTVAMAWLMGIYLVSLSFHFIVVLFKKELDDSMWGFVTLLAVFGLLGASEYFGWFKLSSVSTYLFTQLITTPLVTFIPLLLLISLYVTNYYVFRQGMYLEEVSKQKQESYGVTKDLSFLNSLGSVGEWINLEWKLILRNKRTRNILLLCIFFLAYGIIFYPQKKYTEEMPGFLLFVGIFITGIFMINYGQMLFSWQGSHMDFILTQPISMREFVVSKYWLMCIITLICFTVSIPYVYFGWKILLIHIAAACFNLGVNSFIIMNMAMWDPKKVDLKNGSAFNYQGIGAAQWIMGIPILLAPYAFYLPFSFAGYPNVGLLAVALVGLIGIVFRNKLLDLTVKRLTERKYAIAAGFRKE